MTSIGDHVQEDIKEKLNSSGSVEKSSNDESQPMWKVGPNYYPINEMDPEFTKIAIRHCLSKINEHTSCIQEAKKKVERNTHKMDIHLKSLKVFHTKFNELKEHSEKHHNREITEILSEEV